MGRLAFALAVTALAVSCDVNDAGTRTDAQRGDPQAKKPSPEALLQDAQAFVAEGKPGYARNRIELLKRLFPESREASEAETLLEEINRQIAENAKALAATAAEDRERRAREKELERKRKWSYRASTDPMTSKLSRTASIQSENTVNFDFPYQGSQRATLTLRVHPSYGTDVILSISQGQILCPSYESCEIRIRFDDNAARTWTAIGPQDNSSRAIFIRNYSRFLNSLRSSEEVRIQVPVYQEGAPIFTFDIGGFDFEEYSGA